MPKNTEEPITLGDKLQSRSDIRLSELFIAFLVPAIFGLVSWWVLQSIVSGISAFAICAIFLIAVLSTKERKEHFLIHADWNGFMKSLILADKTAIFDGSNIYHFGLENGFGTKPLQTLIQKLRDDGYRIICFFDANIYFTLRENGEFLFHRERFSPAILQRIFGMKANEIYVVPSKIQADRFIVETLSHLPISFAVTNDRFRDFTAEYDFLAKNNEWRKGVRIKGGKLSLNQYSFKEPLTL